MVNLINNTQSLTPQKMSKDEARGILAKRFKGCSGCPFVGDTKKCPNANFLTAEEKNAADTMRHYNQDGSCERAGEMTPIPSNANTPADP